MNDDDKITGTLSPTLAQEIITGTDVPVPNPESGRSAITLEILDAASAKALPSIVIIRLFDI
jgi:hypothetical protein